MSAQDWKLPFLSLREKLLAINESYPQLYHSVLFSFQHDLTSLGPVIASLEPAYVAKKELHRIGIPMGGCQFHGHFFFGEQITHVQRIQRELVDLRQWVEAIPKGLLPRLDVPRLPCQSDTNLVLWMNLVYQLAFLINAPYLTAQVEYQAVVGSFPFCLWHECPQPPGCNPAPWLIHQGDPGEQLVTWQARFQEQGYRFPDVIDAYLDQELVVASIAAIDVLVFMAEQLQEHLTQQCSGKPPRSVPGELRKRIEREQNNLVAILLSHFAKPPPEGEENKALTQDEIAFQLNWVNEDGKPLRKKVHDRMEHLFGPNPVNAYKTLFRDGEVFDRLRDGAKKDSRDKLWHEGKCKPPHEIADSQAIDPNNQDCD